jgi:maltooligosyltrehalose trehalohydrolase
VIRKRAVGAEVSREGTHFRVWAPAQKEVVAVLDGRDVFLEPEGDGYFSAFVRGVGAGALYRLNGFPDPASRFQPQGPHGPSQVVDPSTYRWRDDDWRGVQLKGIVAYELHIGTFTREGTYAAASKHLGDLAEIGINLIELMPLHEFPGTFGWGYDGVDLWAPYHCYGEPDDLRRFVDEAHAHGIGVILDVVYNHFGPDGCYVREFSPSYFSNRYENEWGEAINFDGEHSAPVREFMSENAAYWIDEFHFDGLRLDATQSLHDASERHIVREISDRARAAAPARSIVIVAENEPQDARLIREYGVDAMWNDDWHHAAVVAATGRIEAYYSDYRGRPQEFISMARLGFLYQGQYYKWQRKRRGTPSHDVAPEHFVCFMQNHDQVANTNHGERVAHPALTALLLLQPQTPMLFQGQELGAQTPFLYFADHNAELAELVAKGRSEFMGQFPSVDTKSLPLPHDRATFESCKLDRAHVDDGVLRMHRELIALRRERPFCEQRNDWLHGAVLGEECFALRWLTGDADDRLLLVNLGEEEVRIDPVSEPLLAGNWRVRWSYGDVSTDPWRISRNAAAVFAIA